MPNQWQHEGVTEQSLSASHRGLDNLPGYLTKQGKAYTTPFGFSLMFIVQKTETYLLLIMTVNEIHTLGALPYGKHITKNYQGLSYKHWIKHIDCWKTLLTYLKGGYLPICKQGLHIHKTRIYSKGYWSTIFPAQSKVNRHEIGQ